MQHSGKYKKLYNFDVFGVTVKHEFTLNYPFGYTIEKEVSKTIFYICIFSGNSKEKEKWIKYQTKCYKRWQQGLFLRTWNIW